MEVPSEPGLAARWATRALWRKPRDVESSWVVEDLNAPTARRRWVSGLALGLLPLAVADRLTAIAWGEASIVGFAWTYVLLVVLATALWGPFRRLLLRAHHRRVLFLVLPVWFVLLVGGSLVVGPPAPLADCRRPTADEFTALMRTLNPTGDMFGGAGTGANAAADHDGATYLIAEVHPDRGRAVWVVQDEVVIPANSLAAELQGSAVETEIVPRLHHCELETGSSTD